MACLTFLMEPDSRLVRVITLTTSALLCDWSGSVGCSANSLSTLCKDSALYPEHNALVRGNLHWASAAVLRQISDICLCYMHARWFLKGSVKRTSPLQHLC